MAHVSSPGRLKEDGFSFNLISRAPMSLPYNRRGGKERVLALSNKGDEFAELRYDQSRSFPFTSSPSVSYQLLPLGEFFGQEDGCEKFGGGDCGGCGQTPLKVMRPTCSPRCYGREMVVVEEQQMTQSTRGGGGGRGDDIAPWEESCCLAKFSEFLGFPIEGFKEEILELVSRIGSWRQKGKGKGGAVSAKFDRELKKLEWIVMDSGRKKNGALGKGVRASHSGL